MSTTAKNNTTQKKETEVKKEFTLVQVLAMWRYKSKTGKGYYFSGKMVDGRKIVGFYNGKKENPKEPDIRIYKNDENGNREEQSFLSLWCNTKGEKKYLTGKLDGKRVVGFFRKDENPDSVKPYFTLYWSDDNKKKEDTQRKADFEEIETDNDLPF